MPEQDKQKSKQYNKNVKEDYEMLFQSERGQRVLNHVLRINMTSSYVTQDLSATVFNEGRRAKALEILNLALPEPKKPKNDEVTK